MDDRMLQEYRREPDPEFAPLLADGIRDHSVNTERRKKQRCDAEQADQPHGEHPRGRLRRQQILDWPHRVEGQIGIDSPYLAPEQVLDVRRPARAHDRGEA